MPVKTQHDLGDVVATVDDYFLTLFARLEAMRDRVAALFDAGPVASSAASTAIAPLVRDLLTDERVMGSGFVAGHGTLSDRALYLAWWQGEDRHLLAESESPDSGDALDYTRHPWYRVPERTGRRHLAGPYVDFVCTDEYVMTATVPVLADGRMVGVVGADTLVETLEGMLLGLLREADPSALLVNDHGRAVVSASPRVATGSLVDLASAPEVLPCADLPLRVTRVH
ncbi:hypothetical protein CLV56_1708 [Mumia flava]|uniref:Cache domain-containing protein n=1 Tax=Mumia flava TaxID=1348852 RepID=A0A2M9BHQ2_9ACTN|nr:cache domain-containing protein [Mumia flava]PJJ57476.1 hypothetical protein CLV56_1708 [Mumia flava]